jgi:nitric oxide reductase subunit B
MRYRSQAVAYPYFAVALLLFGLQVAFGLLAAAKYLGPDPLLNVLPFDRVKEIHTNLLIVWVLTGFMGASYYRVPEESGAELWGPTLAYIAMPRNTSGSSALKKPPIGSQYCGTPTQ